MNGRGEPREESRELADILREAGVAATGRGGRRRRADTDDSADSEPLAASDAGTTNGNRGTSSNSDGNGWDSRRETTSGAGDSSTYSLRPAERRPRTSSRSTSGNGSRAAARNGARNGSRERSRTAELLNAAESAESPWSRTDTAPVPIHEWGSEPDSDPDSGWSHDDAAAATATRRKDNGATTSLPKRQPGVSMSGVSIPGVSMMGASTSTSSAGDGSTSTGVAERDLSYEWPIDADDRASTSHANRSPSPVETTPPLEDDDEQASAVRGGVFSWAMLLVEVLATVGLGIAVWYAFSALWDLLPYVAAFAGPLVVTGLVAVAGALRARTGRNPLGLPTLCILVFAGTVLVVLPAATRVIT